MADTLTTLADMVMLNDVSVRDAGATNIFNDAPLLRSLAALPASHGTQHKYLREDGAPVVGFRAANAGIDWSADSDELVTVDLKILEASFGIDKALADSYPKGASAAIHRKGMRHLRQAMFVGEKQFLYGTGADSGGFKGLAQLMNDTADDQVVNAGGSTALTSVWMFRSTGDEENVCVIAGNNGEIKIEPYHAQSLTDASGKHFAGYVQPILGWMGMAIGSSYSVCRIANIGTDTGKGLTDALLSQGYAKFKEGAPPTHIVMNIRSQMQWQQSRTTYSPTGSEAPIPTSWNGIPVFVTGSIGNAETALTSTPVANAAATEL